MEVCSNDHSEIVFTDKKCPLCEAEAKIVRLEEEIEDLKENNK